MNRFSLGLVFVLVSSFAVIAQSDRSTRPRVAGTPAPVIQGDPLPQAGRTAPVLGGSTRSRQPNDPAASPTPPAAGGEDEIVRVETNLVTMPVSVLDRDGRFITGLTQRDFRIYENGVEQKVDYFQSVEQPFTVILMLDVSPSTQYRIDEIQDAAIAFVDQLRGNDRVMVIAFDDTVRTLSRVTNDRRELRNAIRMAQFGDGTSLYEAVDHVLSRELRQIEGRKAVVLFTDGVDTTSRRASYQSTIADVEETEALFYPIRYNTQRDGYFGRGGGGGGGGWGGYPQRRRRGGWGDAIGIILGGGQVNIGGGPAGSSAGEYETGRRYLETLAKNSGGRSFEADTTGNLDAAFTGIAEELRRQYSLGYYPDAVGQVGERRQIRIRVMRPNVVVRAKSSYIVGASEKRFAGR